MAPYRTYVTTETAEEAEQIAEALAARADLLRQQKAGTPDVRASLYRIAGRFFEAAEVHHAAAHRAHDAKTAAAFSVYMLKLAEVEKV
jgi:hypothetical protein